MLKKFVPLHFYQINIYNPKESALYDPKEDGGVNKRANYTDRFYSHD